MKTLSFLLLVLSLSTQAFAEVTCESKAEASCLTSDGLCLDFIQTEDSDLEAFEGLCEQSEGQFAEVACDQSLVALKCLLPTNPMMSVMNFLKDGFSREDATMACSMLSGLACP